MSSKVIRNTKRSNSTATCNLNEELAPTDENLQYDFNFQQANKLPNEVTIYPVSSHHVHEGMALVISYSRKFFNLTLWQLTRHTTKLKSTNISMCVRVHVLGTHVLEQTTKLTSAKLLYGQIY